MAKHAPTPINTIFRVQKYRKAVKHNKRLPKTDPFEDKPTNSTSFEINSTETSASNINASRHDSLSPELTPPAEISPSLETGVDSHYPESIAPQRTQEPRLLQLPPEIRNQIWEYVLGAKEYRVQVRKSKPICKSKYGKPTERQLLCVCKQIHSETALLPIKLNVFYVLPHLVGRWLRTECFTVAQEDSITNLIVNFSEARYGARYLSYFWGLRRVYVAWTPDNQAPKNLAAIADRLRKDADKPDLRVIFSHNG